MNNERRKRIAAVIDLMTDARSKLEEVLDDEREAFEALPDNLREGERGEAAEAAIDALENAVTDLENDESALEEITGGIQADRGAPGPSGSAVKCACGAWHNVDEKGGAK